MIRTVKEGKHRFTPPMWGLHIGKSITRTVEFDYSCTYLLPEQDQNDWNKLIGKSDLLGPHHTSFRFAWRYNECLNLIDIAAYWYFKGKRSHFKLGELEFNRKYEFTIKEGFNGSRNSVFWYINGQDHFVLPFDFPLIGWKLGPYFGGNNPAPHEMKILIK